ncbi:type 3 dihydrofolate reductase [Neptuniibacter caesariensis]|uniref:Dihydrofolate reductase n=1 Tax=Neptuniibacter caesariensis TaxID=207954 RepID=A0A7U8C6Q6_NEPCE|nr:type 3 dihydrofolate reductase [Neptuniibacter caesariensis]EAR61100.1 dihydrofolate reductase [Oceanospirillum sp. MED92] [Neptuniibacter caesariensis]
MNLAIIVAQAKNRVIGINNKLPWHLPEDLRYFKQVTMGKPIIMGRNTYESIGRPLPGRTNIVITRQNDYAPEGVRVVNSLEEAVELAESIALINGIDEAMVIGGAQIYEQALASAQRLYLTEVDAEIDGDAWFPEFERQEWSEVGREDFSAEGPNPYNYSFIVLDRK